MQKSVNKSVICLAFCVPLVFGSVFLAGTLEFNKSSSPFLSSFFPQLSNGSQCRGGGSPQPLRVYMYDLPARFNVGLMDPNFPDDRLVTAENIPAWGWNDGLRRQHSVEYWMMASLLHKGAGDGGEDGGSVREAVRVVDPNSADVFFVPFFSSLSFNIHVRNMAETDTVDEKLQLELVNILKASEHWKKSGGKDHVIPLHHPNALRHHRDELNSSIFIVADFGRISHISRLAKDVVAPYPHMLETYKGDEDQDPYESRKTLLFFRGRTHRKDEGKVRAKLHKMLNGTKDVIYEEGFASEEGFKASADQMRSSKFCLHPAGDTPSSCRLFDAIVSHCVPVIVSDRIELPFEDELDYKDFSIFFSNQEATTPGYMVGELRKVSRERWVEMWAKLKNISHHFEFQYPPKKEDAVNMIWRQVKHKVPTVRLDLHRSRRLKIPDWWR